MKWTFFNRVNMYLTILKGDDILFGQKLRFTLKLLLQ